VVDPPLLLEYLRRLSNVGPHLWLTGGVAVDFLVGRWTRLHKDLDLVALTPNRQLLEIDLPRQGFVLAQDGAWTTRWSVVDPVGEVEIVFVEPAEPKTGVVVIPSSDAHGGRPGRYPLLPDYLDPDRKAELDGVRFRVCSPEGEWLARIRGVELVPGRSLEPKIQHDLKLLDGLVPESRRRALLAPQS
jgi:hypothetical protein